MVQYYEIAGKAVSLHPIKLHVCHVVYIAGGSKELICTNLTVKLKQQLAHYLSYRCLACWLGRSYFSVTLSCKVPYFHSNFHVVTPRTAGCGFCFPATSVSCTVTCIRALWYAVWCMGGWLVVGLRAIVPLISSSLGKKSIASSDMSCRWQR
jgi:hypothetical protein